MFLKNSDKILLLHKLWGTEPSDGAFCCPGYGPVGTLFDDIGPPLFKILSNISFFWINNYVDRRV